MYPEEIEEKFLPIFHTDLFKDDESNIAETCKDDLLNVDETESNRPDTNENPNTNECKQEATNIDPPTSSQSSLVVVASSSFIGDESENANPTNAKRKGKKSNISHNHNVDECVLESGAIAIASPKRLEKRFRKKDKTENGEIELCELCGLSFVINSNEYKKHLRSHKKKRKPFLCFECLYSFQTSKINYFFFFALQKRRLSNSIANFAQRASITSKPIKSISIHTRTKSNSYATCAANRWQRKIVCEFISDTI